MSAMSLIGLIPGNFHSSVSRRWGNFLATILAVSDFVRRISHYLRVSGMGWNHDLNNMVLCIGGLMFRHGNGGRRCLVLHPQHSNHVNRMQMIKCTQSQWWANLIAMGRPNSGLKRHFRPVTTAPKKLPYLFDIDLE